MQIETGEGLGSGFVYDKSGLILTAAHVVDGARAGQGPPRRRHPASTARSSAPTTAPTSPSSAVEHRQDLPVAPLATGVDVTVGQTAVAIGSPFGLDQTVTAGIVSAVGRATDDARAASIPAIQTDAAINPGNSGGALADRQGRVIGINDSIATEPGRQRGGNLGVGFAIPIDLAK